jgi:glutamine synthetase
MILPASLRYQHDVAAAVHAAAQAGTEPGAQRELLQELVDRISQLQQRTARLDQAMADEGTGDTLAHARYQLETVLPAMQAVRETADQLEGSIDDAYWPLPHYREMLFVR